MRSPSPISRVTSATSLQTNSFITIFNGLNCDLRDRSVSKDAVNAFQKLLDFLVRLDNAKIYYSLARIREETIAVEVAVPGERWEVEFFADGQVEIEVFSSVGAGGIQSGDEALLDRLFATHRS